jgi:DNA end-binding protein Ku
MARTKRRKRARPRSATRIGYVPRNGRKKTRSGPAAKKSKRAGGKKAGGARAIWKGEIHFGSVTLPVKLYSAVQDRSIHFRLLDEKYKEPVRQHMIDPESGEIVDGANIRRAIQVGKNKLVILEKEELDEIELEGSREIEITRFVEPGRITHQWYERPYYLGPDGDAKKYSAVVEAMRNQKSEGLARWIMRKKDYVGALRVEGDHLMLITLRHATEVIPAAELNPPAGRDVGKRELDMARQLVETMVAPLDVTAFRDEYRDRVLELVDAKAKGKVVRLPKARAKRAPASLESVLERSIAAAKKERKSA